jgi:hypothetical protein
VSAAAIGVAQEEEEEEGIDQQDIFHRVVVFLVANRDKLDCTWSEQGVCP